MARVFKTPVTVEGDVATSGVLKSTISSANEGGQIELTAPSSGSTISTNVTIDVYQNKLRFFEAGGTNRGYYIDITGGASSVGSSLTSGSTGAMNYAQTVGTKQSAISSAGTTIVSASITTNGYPVQVTVTGDVENNSAGGWVVLQLYRGSTAIGNPVHAESSAGSENVPYALSVVDAPAAGTYTYALKLNNSAGGTFNFGESNGPVITAVELSGPKGDTGATGTVVTNALTIKSDSGTTEGTDLYTFTGASAKTINLVSGTNLTIAETAGTLTFNVANANWDSAYTDRLKWDGGATGLTASTGRTSLGATTVGSNLFTLTNPGAVTFLKLNADNTVTAESQSTHRTSLGLGTMATETASNYAALAGASFTGNVSTTGTVTATGNVIGHLATNAQTGTTYTLVLGDDGKAVEMNNASANTVTIPLNSSVAFPIGTQITIIQTGAGQTSLAVTGGVTLNATPQATANTAKLRATWSSVTLLKRATDTWIAMGDLTA